MHDQVVELAKQGAALAPQDRSRLVDLLLVSLHEDPIGQIGTAWDNEAERRLTAYDRGEIQAIDGRQVLAIPAMGRQDQKTRALASIQNF